MSESVKLQPAPYGAVSFQIARMESFVSPKGSSITPAWPALPFDLHLLNSVELVLDSESGDPLLRSVPKPKQLFVVTAFELAHCRLPLASSEFMFMREVFRTPRAEIAAQLKEHLLNVHAVETAPIQIPAAYECDFRDFIRLQAIHDYPWLADVDKTFNIGHYRELCSVTFPNRPTFNEAAYQTIAKATLVIGDALVEDKPIEPRWSVEIIKTPLGTS